MRLRNKKTGKIYTLSEDLYIEYTQGGKIEVRPIIPEGNMSFYYESLTKLNEDWEDVKEPLIKDEKIRKAVRAWFEANGLNYANCYESAHSWYLRAFNSREQGIDIYFWGYQLPKELKDCETYTIDELCGSEEIEILEPTYTTIEEKEKLKEEE